MLNLLRILVLINVFCCSNFIFAQEDDGFLTFNGFTNFNGKPISGVNIVVYRNNKKFTSTTSSRKGKFKVSLEYFSKYTIQISKNDIETINIYVNTTIPRNELPVWTSYFTKVPCIIEKEDSLYKEILKRDGLILVKYDLEKHVFDDSFIFDVKEFQKLEPENTYPTQIQKKEKIENAIQSTKTTTDIHVKEEINQRKAGVNKQEVQRMQNKTLEQALKQDVKPKQKSSSSASPTQSQITNSQNATSDLKQQKTATKNHEVKESKNNTLITDAIKNSISNTNNKEQAHAKPQLIQKEEKGYLYTSLTTEAIWPHKKITLLKETTIFGVERYYVDKQKVSKEEFYIAYNKIIDLGL